MDLQNSNRIRTKELVSLFPGIHLRRLQKLLGASFSTTRYHVENLEHDGEIERTTIGGHCRLYPAGTDLETKAVYTVLQGKTARRVLRALIDGGGGNMSNGDLAGATQLPRSTVSECISVLCSANVVVRFFALDGRTLYGLREKGRILQLLEAFDKSILSTAADDFIDLWDF